MMRQSSRTAVNIIPFHKEAHTASTEVRTFVGDQQALADAPQPTAQRGYRSCMPALATVLPSQYRSSLSSTSTRFSIKQD